jgi:hypothetical protein
MKRLLSIFVVVTCASVLHGNAPGKSAVWQGTVKDGMQHVEKMGLMGPYDVSASSIWVPLTVPMAEVFKVVPETELIEFLKALRSETASSDSREATRHRGYIDYCIRGVEDKAYRSKLQVTWSTGEKEDFVYLLIPMGDFIGKAPKAGNNPAPLNKSAQPTSSKGG